MRKKWRSERSRRENNDQYEKHDLRCSGKRFVHIRLKTILKRTNVSTIYHCENGVCLNAFCKRIETTPSLPPPSPEPHTQTSILCVHNLKIVTTYNPYQHVRLWFMRSDLVDLSIPKRKFLQATHTYKYAPVQGKIRKKREKS